MPNFSDEYRPATLANELFASEDKKDYFELAIDDQFMENLLTKYGEAIEPLVDDESRKKWLKAYAEKTLGESVSEQALDKADQRALESAKRELDRLLSKTDEASSENLSPENEKKLLAYLYAYGILKYAGLGVEELF